MCSERDRRDNRIDFHQNVYDYYPLTEMNVQYVAIVSNIDQQRKLFHWETPPEKAKPCRKLFVLVQINQQLSRGLRDTCYERI